jgi:hypothetical protein
VGVATFPSPQFPSGLKTSRPSCMHKLHVCMYDAGGEGRGISMYYICVWCTCARACATKKETNSLMKPYLKLIGQPDNLNRGGPSSALITVTKRDRMMFDITVTNFHHWSSNWATFQTTSISP